MGGYCRWGWAGCCGLRRRLRRGVPYRLFWACLDPRVPASIFAQYACESRPLYRDILLRLVPWQRGPDRVGHRRVTSRFFTTATRCWGPPREQVHLELAYKINANLREIQRLLASASHPLGLPPYNEGGGLRRYYAKPCARLGCSGCTKQVRVR